MSLIPWLKIRLVISVKINQSRELQTYIYIKPATGDFLGPSQVRTPACTDRPDDTTRCSPGKDAENKLSRKQRIAVSLKSKFKTSLGQESPDPPGDLSGRDL